MGTRDASLSIAASLKGLITNVLSATKTARPSAAIDQKKTIDFKTGTGPNQLDFIHCDEGRVLLDTINLDIDLFDLGTLDVGAGAGLDLLGQAINLAEITVIAIVNKSTAGELVVGGEGSAAAFKQFFNNTGVPADSSITVKAGGYLLLAAPLDPAYPVTDSTNHLLRLSAAGGDQTFDILIGGRSA